MLLLNLKQSFRNLGRNKVYTSVNLAGLSISGAFILLVAVYITHALQMDRYSASLNSIYRVEKNNFWKDVDTTKKKGVFDWLAKDNEVQNQLVMPFVTGEDLKSNFPEIQQYCRIQTFYEPILIANNKKFKEDGTHVAYVDK